MINEVMTIVAFDKKNQKWGMYRLVPETYKLELFKVFNNVEDAVLNIRLFDIVKENKLVTMPDDGAN